MEERLSSLSLKGVKLFYFISLLFFTSNSIALSKVFEVPTESYPTLKSALEEAFSNTEEDTIYLLSDILENVSISFNGGVDKVFIEPKEGIFNIDGEGKDRCLKIEVKDGSLSLRIKGIRFVNAFSNDKGGAILLDVSTGAFCSLEAFDVAVEASTSSSHGGGIALVNYGVLNADFRRCVFKDNRSSNRGGAILIDNSNVTFENCLVVKNTSAQGGGGLYIVNGSHVLLKSSTISDNVAKSGVTKKDGGGLYLANISMVEVRNSIVWGNDGSLNNKDVYLSTGSSIQCRYSLLSNFSGEGCISGDPLFGEGYTLSPNSPCIDAGDPGNYPKDDLFGALRPADGNNDGKALPDIGAIEAQYDITPPLEVSGFQVLPSTYSVSLSWKNPNDLDFDLVRVYITSGSEVWKKIYETKGEELEVQELSANTEYLFKLTTLDLFGNESSGSIINVRTLEETVPPSPDVPPDIGPDPGPEPKPDIIPPKEVFNLLAFPSTFSITLLWSNPDDEDFVGCKVYMGDELIGGVSAKPSSQSSFTVPNLMADTHYSFRVATVDEVGNESRGVSISTKTLSYNTPPVIKELSSFPSFGGKGTIFKLSCFAEDHDGDEFRYEWKVDDESAGLLVPYSSEAYFIAYAFSEDRLVKINLRVVDDRGAFAERTITLNVKGLTGKDSDGDGLEDSLEKAYAFDPKVVYCSEREMLCKVSSGKIENFSLKGDNPYEFFFCISDIGLGEKVKFDLYFPFPVVNLHVYFWEGGAFKSFKNFAHSLDLADGGEFDLDGRADGKVVALFKLFAEPVEVKGGCELSKRLVLPSISEVVILFSVLIFLVLRRIWG